MERRMVRIWRAGDQLSVLDWELVIRSLLRCVANVERVKEGGGRRVDLLFNTSRQMRPSLSTLGWKILVRKRILGGTMG